MAKGSRRNTTAGTSPKPWLVGLTLALVVVGVSGCGSGGDVFTGVWMEDGVMFGGIWCDGEHPGKGQPPRKICTGPKVSHTATTVTCKDSDGNVLRVLECP